MTPDKSLDDLFDGRSANAKHARERSRSVAADPVSIQRSNPPHLRFSQARFGVLLAFCLTAFLLPVCHIVINSPQKQMSGIDTERIVAMMANQHPVGNWPEMDFPRETMGFDASSGITEHPIAFLGSTSPAPTDAASRMLWSNLIYFRPEILDRVFRPETDSGIAIPFPANVVETAQVGLFSPTKLAATRHGTNAPLSDEHGQGIAVLLPPLIVLRAVAAKIGRVIRTAGNDTELHDDAPLASPRGVTRQTGRVPAFRLQA